VTRRWLSVVGIGDDGLDGLAPAARALVDHADVLVGGVRHLDMVPQDGRERLTWPRPPLSDLIPLLEERKHRAVCVLATGDPMSYGIGVTLARHIAAEEMTIIPSPSAFALACARLGWPLAEIETLTLHGRPPALVESFVQPGARLLILSDGAETPGTVAELLRARGYGDSRLTVLEHMGGERERIWTGFARDWAASGVAPFNTLAVECLAGPDAALLPRVPGLPDEAYRHDGQLTKREVRAATLAALAPVPGQLLWDVGAGAGSVAIEWMRAHPTCRAVAVERDPDRLRLIADNATALGAPRLDMVAGEAPAALDGLAPPDAVFVGGGAATPGLFEACWQALRPRGRLVANAITVEGEGALYRWREETGGTLVRIAVSRAEPVGGFSGWRALSPVTQLTAVKP
jgi:precorrin-6Y C5,15-methyltransferase (decarboxylating)